MKVTVERTDGRYGDGHSSMTGWTNLYDRTETEEAYRAAEVWDSEGGRTAGLRDTTSSRPTSSPAPSAHDPENEDNDDSPVQT